MTLTATDVEATLRYVVPGFIALKVFYLFGLRTRRTDLEWTLWSILAAAAIDTAAGLLNPSDATKRLLIAVALALAAGVVGALLWRLLVRQWPVLGIGAARRAWDAILPLPQWLQIWTKSDTLIFGRARVVASSVEADQLDIYVEEPQWVNIATGERLPMNGVAGLLIAESEVRMIQVLDGKETPSVTPATAATQ